MQGLSIWQVELLLQQDHLLSLNVCGSLKPAEIDSGRQPIAVKCNCVPTCLHHFIGQTGNQPAGDIKDRQSNMSRNIQIELNIC